MLSRFHTIPERKGRTDRKTYKRTNGQTDIFAISISRVSMLTRDKNYAKKSLALFGLWTQCICSVTVAYLVKISSFNPDTFTFPRFNT